MWNVRARGYKAALTPLLGRPVAELASTNVGTSLFETDAFDDDVIALVNSLCCIPRIKLANATKLLHQKRPHLITILDTYMRQAFDLVWMPGDPDDFTSVLRAFFKNVRDFNRRNAETLSSLDEWLSNNGWLPLSRLRVIDILAWDTIRRRG